MTGETEPQVCGVDRRRHTCAGFSLVELLVASVIIVIIFIAWLRIANFQAVRKESLRRLAIEKAAGYLDVMTVERPGSLGQYRIAFTNDAYVADALDPAEAGITQHLFEVEVVETINGNTVTNRVPKLGSPGYVLRVMTTAAITDILAHDDWPPGNWALIQLYDEHGVTTNDAGRVFSTMSVFLE